MIPSTSKTSSGNSHQAAGVLGYNVQDVAYVHDKALRLAGLLIGKSRKMASETRAWADKLSVYLSSKPEQTLSSLVLEQKDFEQWQRSCLTLLKNFLEEMGRTMKHLGKLNPPLTTEELKPMVQSIVTERHLTLTKLQPLADKLRALAGKRSDFLSEPAEESFYPGGL